MFYINDDLDDGESVRPLIAYSFRVLKGMLLVVIVTVICVIYYAFNADELDY